MVLGWAAAIAGFLLHIVPLCSLTFSADRWLRHRATREGAQARLARRQREQLHVAARPIAMLASQNPDHAGVERWK